MCARSMGARLAAGGLWEGTQIFRKYTVSLSGQLFKMLPET